MARGQESKVIITNKILEMFEGSFQYDKEIRIPIVENGETVQIKCTLACAKTNVENGAGNEVPSASSTPTVGSSEMTEQEKSEVKDLISKLGL